ncbi:MAG: hypothetical protein QNJ72_10100 [Pleurocapsa sp. MO_226.B13]|nr:hypothetical protein [Pleurocapsa sp. MO_226.B13]
MSFSERDLQKKLEEIEAEINQESTSNSYNSQQSSSKSVFSQFEINPSPQVQGWIDSAKAWFGTLPQIGKAAVAIGGVWLGFSIVGAVLHVVSSILNIALVGLVLYIGYRLFNKNSSSN